MIRLGFRMKISVIIFFLLLFPIFVKANNTKDCKKENAQACYDKGSEIFNTLDKAKNDVEANSIKKTAALVTKNPAKKLRPMKIF